jgi:hypothetical protein
MTKKLKKSKYSSKKEHKSKETPSHSGDNHNNLKEYAIDIQEKISSPYLGSTDQTSVQRLNNSNLNLSGEQKPLISGFEENSLFFNDVNSPSSLYDNRNEFLKKNYYLKEQRKSPFYSNNTFLAHIYKQYLIFSKPKLTVNPNITEPYFNDKDSDSHNMEEGTQNNEYNSDSENDNNTISDDVLNTDSIKCLDEIQLHNFPKYSKTSNNNTNHNEIINKKKKEKNIFSISKIVPPKSPFNYDTFKKNYNKEDIDRSEPKGEPEFIDMDTIIKSKLEQIKRLWTRKNPIFKDKNDLNNTNGNIYRYLLSFLKKEKENIQLIRSRQPDEMSQKIKSFVLDEILNSTNKFDEFQNYKLDKIDKHKVYEPTKRDFQLSLLEKEIYLIISNDVNLNCNPKYNYNKINEIITSGKNDELQAHLKLTFQDCLDIITYKKVYDDKKSDKFDKKLIEFLYKVYGEIKINDNEKDKEEEIKKDYIAAMLLLAYNFKRLFFIKESRDFRSDKDKNKKQFK